MHNQYNHTLNCILQTFVVIFTWVLLGQRWAWLRVLACARGLVGSPCERLAPRARLALLARCFGRRGFYFWQLMDLPNWQLMDLPNDRQLHYDLVIIELIMYSSFSVVCFNVIARPGRDQSRYAPPSERLKYYFVLGGCAARDAGPGWCIRGNSCLAPRAATLVWMIRPEVWCAALAAGFREVRIICEN